jgi:diaminopimelate epimerase
MSPILYDALGNRYLVLPFGETLSGPAARHLCAFHGSDGILLGRREADGAFSLTIFNADGSAAENSGNGTRIFARYLWDEGVLDPKKPCILVPPSGPIRCTLHGDDTVGADLGQPAMGTTPLRLSIRNGSISGYVVSLGNPHFVAPVPSFPDHWEKIAKEIADQPIFQSGTNVELMKILDNRSIAMRVHERGVGRTSSCGSGAACAAAVAARFFAVDPQMVVTMEGGSLSVSVSVSGVHIRGPITRIF